MGKSESATRRMLLAVSIMLAFSPIKEAGNITND